MKSPAINVGIIEPDGILNGSIKNVLMTNTNNRMGKNSRAIFIPFNSHEFDADCEILNKTSTRKTKPNNKVDAIKMIAKIISHPLSKSLKKLLEVFQHYPLVSFSFFLLFVFLTIFFFYSRHRHNIWPKHFFA